MKTEDDASIIHRAGISVVSVGGWFTNPFETYACQNGNLPQIGVMFFSAYMKPPSDRTTSLLPSSINNFPTVPCAYDLPTCFFLGDGLPWSQVQGIQVIHFKFTPSISLAWYHGSRWTCFHVVMYMFLYIRILDNINIGIYIYNVDVCTLNVVVHFWDVTFWTSKPNSSGLSFDSFQVTNISPNWHITYHFGHFGRPAPLRCWMFSSMPWPGVARVQPGIKSLEPVVGFGGPSEGGPQDEVTRFPWGTSIPIPFQSQDSNLSQPGKLTHPSLGN